ncbi:hypothetical protein [Polymorphospora sp. NPDC050346]|uniref:hypothetical protein n=1 Tax=Polymorphospora sp. NPDC050346 TaxID=3155780 RepID=UPI003401E528
MRTRILAAAAATALAVAVLATGSPAVAAPTGDTTATFTIEAGTLDVVVPATATIDPTVVDGTITGALGTVTVTDGRGELSAAWAATASATDFTTGGGTASETVPASSVVYTTGSTTVVSGEPTATPGAPGPLDEPLEVLAVTAVGSNAVSWNPTLTITLPDALVAGTYTGTVTHSVA